MKLGTPLFILLLLCGSISAQSSGQAKERTDEETVKSIYDEALSNAEAYDNLRILCKTIGGRLAGSPEAAKSVQWGKEVMEKMGLDSVYLQECMVPHWVRGETEFGAIHTRLMAGRHEVPICALGNSVGTGPNGVRAKVIEVTSLDQLEELGEDKVKGKIVFYNRPMDPTHVNTFHAYGGCVDQRSQGAIEAARLGAVGTVVRSMNLRLDDFPHTGSLKYADSVPKIPACAISTNGAEILSRMIKRDKDLEFYFRQTCEMLPDEKSHNVIGEIRGSTYPDEVIVVGGHLDSWDLGEGAHDDGAGIVQSMEVLRILKSTGLQPKRTIRCILYMNEENGMRGGLKYGEYAATANEKHIAALESDRGGFTPRGFTVEGSGEHFEHIKAWQPILEPYGIYEIKEGYGGVDISTLRPLGTVLIGFYPDSQRYFDHHHSENDNFEGVHERELQMGAASMAALVWLISEKGVVARENPEEPIHKNVPKGKD